MSKYYLIEVVDMPWGNFEKSATDWTEARQIYKNVKEDFESKKIPCTVQLSSVNTYINKQGIINDFKKIMYKKEIYKEYNIYIQLENMLKSIKTIKDSYKAYTEAVSASDIERNNYYHGLELVNLDILSQEEMVNMLYKIKTDMLIRRISKESLSKISIANSGLDRVHTILTGIKHSLIDKDQQNDINNASEHRMSKNKQYLSSLGIDIETYETTYIEETNKIPNGYEILDEEIHKDLLSSFSAKDSIKMVVDNMDKVQSSNSINSLKEPFEKIREKILFNE